MIFHKTTGENTQINLCRHNKQFASHIVSYKEKELQFGLKKVLWVARCVNLHRYVVTKFVQYSSTHSVPLTEMGIVTRLVTFKAVLRR